MREPNETGPSHDALPAAGVTAGVVTGAVPAAGAGGTHSVGPAQSEDPDEIDVSDQVETLDDTDAASDLDASEYLIIEGEEEDEVTSASIAAWGAGASNGAAVDVPSTDALAPDKEPEARSVPAAPSAPLAVTRLRHTHVAVGTELKGKLASSCPVVIDGVMDGEIDAPTLNIASTGVILGTIKAKTLRSEGTLSAQVDAGEVFVSGTVRSQTVIKTRRLEVKLGASGNGRLQVTFGNCDVEAIDLDAQPDAAREAAGLP